MAVPVVAWYAATRLVLVAFVAMAVVAQLGGVMGSGGAGSAGSGIGVGGVDGVGGAAGASWSDVASATWAVLNSWDAQWMRDIAELGYFGLGEIDGDPGHWRSLAFFPLMPYAMKAISAVTFLTAAQAGVVISVAAGVAFVLGAAALAGRMGMGRRARILASVLVSTAPMGIVMVMPYTEALFLALATWGLVAIVDKRWASAAALCFLAGLTRSTALGLFIVIAVAVLAGDRRNPRAWLAAIVAPIGWAAYLAWSSAQLREAGGYFGAQARGWDSRVDGGAATLRWLWRAIGESDYEAGYAISTGIIVAVACTVAWAFAGWAAACLRPGQRPWPRPRLRMRLRMRPRLRRADPEPRDPERRYPDRWGTCWPVLLFSCLAVGQVLASDGLMHSRPRLFLSGVLVLIVFAPLLARMRRLDRWFVLGGWIGASAWVGAYLLVPFSWAI